MVTKKEFIFSVSLLTKRNDTICKGSFSSNEGTQIKNANTAAVLRFLCSKGVRHVAGAYT